MTVGAGRRGGHLPCEVLAFVGRQHETDEVKRLLAMSRRVTLTGPGGTGKTRLALRVATDLTRSFPDGVWFVELAQLSGSRVAGPGDDVARDVVHLVRAALGLQEPAGPSVGPPQQALAEQLADWRALLVMDNCEDLTGACADVADTLLVAAPEVRILATSREPLKAEDEAVLPVPPLPTPDPGLPLTAAETGRYDSVALFVARAEAALPGFALGEENHDAVAELCRRLDGLPLAIELAAGRVRVLTPQQILQRVSDRFALLRGGKRTAPARQQTLWACVDWSYSMCDRVEQTLWTRLSVFTGGFELDAAEGICTDEALTGEELRQGLAALVEKSVVVRDEDGERVRYRMLETIRDYGRASFRADDEARLRRHHAHWYLRLAERAEREWFGPDQPRWCRRVRAEHANLRSAFDAFLDGRGDGPHGRGHGLRLAADLWFYWLVFALVPEGRDWLRRAIEATGTVADVAAERAKALWVDGHLASVQGDLGAATRRLEAAHALAAEVGDELTRARAAKRLGAVAMHRGDLDQAEDRLTEALRQLELLGPEAVVSVAHAQLALALTRFLKGDHTGAIDLVEELRATCEARGDRYLLAYALNVLARAEAARGNLEAATGHARQAIGLRRTLPHAATLGFSLDLLAWITAASGDHERAAVLVGAAGRVWQSTGSTVRQWAHLRQSRRETEHRARMVLGEDGYAAAVERGAGLSENGIIRYALGGPLEVRPRAQAIGASGLLTRRETQIAELLADGLSNKEISERLVLSQRTVEGHVQTVLTKLGFRSRTQVGIWVRDRERLPVSR